MTAMMLVSCAVATGAPEVKDNANTPKQEETDTGSDTESEKGIEAEPEKEPAAEEVEKTDADEDAAEDVSGEELADDIAPLLAEKAGIEYGDIRLTVFDDFDGDGKFEAFAITGSQPDTDIYEDGITEGSVWFIKGDNCEKLCDSNGMGFIIRKRILELGGRKYVLFDDAFATGVQTHAFEVNGDKASETLFSGSGEVADQDDKDRFRIVDSSYDAIFDPEIGDTIGHTWKSYYFYYDEAADSVREFGGKEITAEAAEKISGRDLVSECLKEGDEVESIYHRANGLTNINYARTDENGYVEHLHRTWDSVKGIYIDDLNEPSDEENAGTYRPALCPDIADYPKD